jgi:dTDP-4-amino-4,6-dideoxygalactose transaminase
MKIPLMSPVGPPREILFNYLNTVYENGVFSNRGPLSTLLEYRYAKYFGVNPERVVLCSNATQGIAGCAFLSPVDYFYCPSFTFPGSALGLLHGGKKIVFVDIDARTWDINTKGIPTSNSSGLQVVLPFGDQPNFDKFKNFKHIIFDAAASIGNPNLNLNHLEENWVAVFSLHATKVLGIGEGGLVVFGNEIDAEKFRKYINFGFFGDRNSEILGNNLKLSEYSAAIGHATLDNIKLEFNEWGISRLLTSELESKIVFNSFSKRILGHNPYWILNFDSEALTNTVERILNQMKIGNRRWWSKGLHAMKAFAKIPILNDLENSNKVARTYLGLPFYRNMNATHMVKIEKALVRIQNEFT